MNMNWCYKCEQEYETEDGCLCAVYRALMRRGHYQSVPPVWIMEYWDEPIYCGYCQAAFMYGNPCACGKAAAWPSSACIRNPTPRGLEVGLLGRLHKCTP